MIKYSRLGMDRQLNEIVFAGSHDAAITSGAENAQTQSLDVLGQANAGVRFFDIRIGAQTVAGLGDTKGVQLRAFHAQSLAKDTKIRHSTDVGRDVEVERNKLKHESLGEAWGLGLSKILRDAKAFVESADGRSEFLILKFDKCSNWALIAETCQKVLGNRIFSTASNVNTMLLSQLAGKVICAFMTPGYSQLKLANQRVGITHIKNLYKPPAGYDQNFSGLQYWGAGGTKINNSSFDDKIRENIATQRKILRSAATGIKDKKTTFTRKVKQEGCAAANPNAMGMMYWTTTGVFKNIQTRNSQMWDSRRLAGLDAIWKSGFEDYISNALPENIDAMSFSSGGTLKLFMPNIVMIDFADTHKCEHIYGLNTVAGVELVKVCQKLDIHGGRHDF